MTWSFLGLQGWWQQAQQGLFRGWQSVKGFLLAVCSQRERPLHFIKLQFSTASGGSAARGGGGVGGWVGGRPH